MNKIYTIKRIDNGSDSYFQYNGFVIVANSEKHAMDIANKHGWGESDLSSVKVVVSEVGTSFNLSPQILLSSYTGE